MKPFQMILVFLRHLKYHLEDVSGFAIFHCTTHHVFGCRRAQSEREAEPCIA